MNETEVVSSYFACSSKSSTIITNKKPEQIDISDDFLHIIDELNERLDLIKIPPPVSCVYNSTIYARHTFERYVRKYCSTKKTIMFFGMNPGPWGMSQTGVPFGEVNSVRDWLGIEGPVGKPPNELSARPVDGFKCKRSEISGKRFWGLIKELCVTPENFFRTSFVYNYLPQQWMKNNGCNVTPSDFNGSQMKELYDICDPVFIKVLLLYEVKTIVAIGKFCEARARKAIKIFSNLNEIQVKYLPHPSPRTVNNNNWEQKALEYLKSYKLLEYYENGTVVTEDG